MMKARPCTAPMHVQGLHTRVVLASLLAAFVSESLASCVSKSPVHISECVACHCASLQLDAPVVSKAFLNHDLATLKLHCGPELLERFAGIFKHFSEQVRFASTSKHFEALQARSTLLSPPSTPQQLAPSPSTSLSRYSSAALSKARH
eukprot:scaffold194580_cov16-Tisochrysis_lutea.AAC.1